MDNEKYKNLTEQNNVVDYTTLNVTLKELSSKVQVNLTEKVKQIVSNNLIEKPSQHNRSSAQATSYYFVDLSRDEIEYIIEMYLELEASFLSESGDTTPTASFYASLADKWSRCIL